MKHKEPSFKVYPSVLSANFARLGDEVKRAEKATADGLHIDIMDGHFVPNLSMGPAIVSAINRETDLFLDVHLMMYNPFKYVEAFVASGADLISFHLEATEEVEETLDYIRKCNVKAGLAISPETSPTLLLRYLDMCDQILIMTVEPGFGGQSFMEPMLDKISFIRKTANELKIPLNIQVDGGINPETAALCKKAGANIFVSGNYLFEGDMKTKIDLLRK